MKKKRAKIHTHKVIRSGKIQNLELYSLEIIN